MNLNYNLFGSKAAKEIAYILLQNLYIEHLYLSGNQIQKSGI